MKKNKKLLKSLIAIVLTFLLVGSIVPTMAYAGEYISPEVETEIEDHVSFIDSLLNDIRNFIRNIVNFFKSILGIEDDPVPVESVTAGEDAITLTLGETETYKLTVEVAPEKATDKALEWKSSNENVVTVDAEGALTVVARGKAIITVASVADPTKADTIAVEIRDPGAIYVDGAQSLKDAMLVKDAVVVLDADIVVDKDTPLQYGAYMFIANGRVVTIDLNGYNIICNEDGFLKTKAIFTTANGGTLNIIGEGTVVVKNALSGIFHAMNKNDQINVYGGTYISNSSNGKDSLAIIYTNSGNVDVYGGKFIPLDGIECANAEDTQGARLSVVFHEGTLLKHDKYQKGDSTRIKLADGCELAEVEINGETWYQVVKA